MTKLLSLVLFWRKAAAPALTFEQREFVASARAAGAVLAFELAADDLASVAEEQTALSAEAREESERLTRLALEKDTLADDLEIRAYATAERAEKIRALVA